MPETRKRTSGGIVTFGKHCNTSWSHKQAVVALSSAESELFGLVKCVSETMGEKSVFSTSAYWLAVSSRATHQQLWV